MDWSLFVHFRAAARFDHLGRAADELGVTQPTLSRSIRTLERFYGLPLFDRYGRTVRLNDNGRALLTHVERALGGLNDAERAMHDRLAAAEGSVAVGFIGTLGSRTIPEVVRLFRIEFPQVTLRLVQSAQPDLLEQLAAGRLDLAITSAGAADDMYCWEHLRDEELYVQVHAGHRFAKRTAVELAELHAEPLVVLRSGTALRSITDRLFASAGVAPAGVCEGQNIVTARGLVAARLGIMLGPLPEDVPADGVIAIAVSAPRCTRPVGLSWLNQHYQSSAVRRFHELIIETERRRAPREAVSSLAATRARRLRA